MASMAGLMLMSMPTECAARQWSLKDCIDYALANNIQLQKAKVQQLSALEDIKQSQSALLHFPKSVNITERKLQSVA